MATSELHTYRCTVKSGHMGSGKYAERDVFVRAPDAARAFAKAKHQRGVKKGRLLRTGGSVLQVVRVD